MRSCPPPFSMSARRLFSPRTRFWPPLDSVSRSTWGFVIRKLEGASETLSSGGQNLGNRVLNVTRGDQIRLLDVVEEKVLRPLLVLEAPVPFGGLGDRLRFHAEHLHPARLPEPPLVHPQVDGHAGEQRRIRSEPRVE